MSKIPRRRAPKQERARATVEAILEATAQLLVEVGYHNTSTNKIAERAGVSVGSLYQYFKNKESIVAALVEQFADRQFELLAARLSAVVGAPLEDAVPQLVRALLETKQLEPELNQVLFEHLPPVGQIDMLRDWTDRAVGVVILALSVRAHELSITNLNIAAYVLVNACHGVIHNTVINRPELLADDALADETARLILGYLTT